jgi:hexosaminidase
MSNAMKHALLSLLLAPLCAAAAPSADLADAPAILPRPASLQLTGKVGFSLAHGVAIAGGKDFPEAAQALAAGMRLQGIVTGAAGDAISFKKSPGLAREAYRIGVTPAGVTVEASSAAGAFYGAQTLVQAVVRDASGKPALPAMQVADAPRFGWRGLMIDPCRHFITLDDTKRIVDLMALYKLNTLHWHLTDDQGWRIEIRKYPKLTQIGAARPASPVIGARDKLDGKPYGPYFYTQDQVKELVAYAKARAITVIPEIEMPGHAAAAIAAYPELGNSDIPAYAPAVRTAWGVEPYVYAPKETTFRFLDDVIGEVAALFPEAPYFHIGGDEVPKEQWEQSPYAQQLMQQQGLLGQDGKTDPHRLQAWFIARVETMVNARGKKLIGWDEIQEGGLSPTATMMLWRSWDWARHAIARGNDVVMSPGSHNYLDHGQGAAPDDPAYEVHDSPHIPLEKAYALDPIPTGLAAGQEKHVLGVQGNVWGEFIFNRAKFDYMTFPRAIALAEVAWSPERARDYTDFTARLRKNERLLDLYGVNYRKPDGTPARLQEPVIRALPPGSAREMRIP